MRVRADARGDPVGGPPSETGHARTISGMEATSDWTGCAGDRPLFVEMSGRVERVGFVLAGTRVENPRPVARGLVPVDLVGPEMRAGPSEISLLSGASFVMTAADAEACR